ncbi:MAG: nucleotidyl transferase AbiEii/AbiGii toxin family protein [Mycobacteriales bacterium]
MAADNRAQRPEGPLAQLSSLRERGKDPASRNVLNAWVNQAQEQVGLDTGRLGWLIASTVVVAALQRAIDADGRSRFLLKGGTYLQHRMSWTSRPTKDIDGLVRGDIEDFLTVLDDALRPPWGSLSLTRSPIEVINSPGKIVKPRRFDVLVSLKGQLWRRIQVEIAPDEADASDEQDILPPPSLHYFGLPTPDHLLGIAIRFQIAQEIHACTDPHQPPALRNDRARDAVDLLLLRDFVVAQQSPTLGRDQASVCGGVRGPGR